MGQHRAYKLVAAVLVAATLLAAWLQPPVLDDLRNTVFDAFQRLDAPAFDPASPVRILAIDEHSLASLGQWPWPRSRLASITQKLFDAGALAVAFDIIFAEPDRTSPEIVVGAMPDGALKADLQQRLSTADSNDAIFARAFGAGPVVLGATLQTRGPSSSWTPKAGIVVAGDSPNAFLPAFPSLVLPIAGLRDAAAGLGATNWLPDRDQIVRRVPLLLRSGEAVMPSLALDALRAAQGASTFVLRASNASGSSSFGTKTGLNAVKVGDVEVDTGADGSIRPRYTHSAPERFLSAADLMAGLVAADAIRGRVIFVGTTAVGLGDVRATPLDPVVPGVEIHAQVFEQLLANRLLSRPDWALGAEVALTMVCLFALVALLPKVAPALGAVVAAATVCCFALGSWLAFSRASLLLDPAFPALTLVASYTLAASLLWQTEEIAKRQIRQAFGKFVSPAVVTRIAENPKLLVLSGETRDLTILFSDLRSFSTISEGLTAHEVAHFLNTYLTPMTDAILQHEGTIDKYIGDAIVAFWNAPLAVADHTRRAVDAALAMRAALAAFNRAQAERAAAGEKVVQDVRMGVGMNFGACSVGNMGSLQRFDYSALGDPMNVAARLEALTKGYTVDLLATVSVVENTPAYAWLEIDAVKVKGRAAETTLYTLFGDEAFAASTEFAAWTGEHMAMLRARREGRPREAAERARTLATRADPRWAPLYESLHRRYAESVEIDAGVLPMGLAHVHDA